MLVGMCVVDLHRLFRNLDRDHFKDVDVLQFSDLLCKNIKERPTRQNARLTSSEDEVLERITDRHGNINYDITDKQSKRGRNVGKSVQHNCYVCRKYLTKKGETQYNQTTFRCVTCKMPLCKKDRSNNEIGRNLSCLDEHLESNCKTIGCFGANRNFNLFPKA
jgi:hypothetical protein